MRRLPVILATVALIAGACGSEGDDAPPHRVVKLQEHTKITEVNTPSKFASIAAAVRYLRRHVDVPVAIPALPAGTRLAKTPVYAEAVNGRTEGGIELTLPGGSDLQIHFGRAGFDGCGGDTATSVRIGHRHGMMLLHDFKGDHNTQVIWPATRRHMEGLYGVYAQLNAARTLALARSMERALQRTERTAAEVGC